jgi:hypothetical protein
MPQSKLKDRLRELFHKKKNGNCRYKYLAIGRDKSYFVETKKI